MWGIPAFLFFFGFLHRVAPGVIVKEIMQAFNATGAIVGLLSAMYFWAYAGLMIPAGVLIDGFGVRRMVAAGSVVMGLGTLVMGLADSQATLMAGRFLVGAVATVNFIGCLKIAADWFPLSHFGTLSAVTATVGVLGALGGTVPLAALVAVAGWRHAVILIAVLTFLGAVACFLFVRDHPPGTASVAHASSLASVLRGVVKVLGNWHTWPPFLTFFFSYSAISNLMLWAVPFLRDVYGLGNTRAAAYASAVAWAQERHRPQHEIADGRVGEEEGEEWRPRVPVAEHLHHAAEHGGEAGGVRDGGGTRGMIADEEEAGDRA